MLPIFSKEDILLNKKNNEIVFDFLKNKIIEGYWKEGDKIYSENYISESLNVSRNSVREAIEKMVALDILNKKKGGGTYLNKLNQSIVFNNLIPLLIINSNGYMEILEFRLGFETQNVELFIKNCLPEDVVKLKNSYDKMLENEGNEKFAYYDALFHKILAEGTKNTIIQKISETLNDLLIYHQKHTNEILGCGDGKIDHANILSFIEAKDIEMSKLYMRRHIEKTIERIKNNLN